MIPYHRLIAEMDRQLTAAKNAGDEQTVREALSAIRSLCEVALSADAVSGSIQPAERPVKHQAVKREERLEEDDANGESIFDF